MTAPLSPVPGPKITDNKMLLVPEWQSWFKQLYVYVSSTASGGGGLIPSTRTISTSSPLSGGGDLSANRTISLLATPATAFLNLFTGTLQGLVAASGGGTQNLLRADGTWTNAVVGSFSASTFLKTGATVVASLPSAVTAGAGARHLVTNALAPAFGAAVVGGGAAVVPVYSDGAAWLVG